MADKILEILTVMFMGMLNILLVIMAADFMLNIKIVTEEEMLTLGMIMIILLLFNYLMMAAYKE